MNPKNNLARYSIAGITGSTLKIMAVVIMLIDHIAASLIKPIRFNLRYSNPPVGDFLCMIYPWMRSIGRLAFPIFCFLLVEGFLHTRNVKKYALRLFLFALISELPFDFALSTQLFYWPHQNVYFTLLIGLLVMIGVQYFDYKPPERKYDRYLFLLLQVAICAAGLLLARKICCDYRHKGVFLIIVLYFLRSDKNLQSIFGAITISWEASAPLAFVPIWLYNGERGLKMKYFFYWFYPGHLLILGIIRHFIIPHIV